MQNDHNHIFYITLLTQILVIPKQQNYLKTHKKIINFI